LITQPEQKILISPIGNLDPELFKPISREISRIFGFPTEVVSLLEDVNFALDPARDQYHSTLILEKLEKISPPGIVKMVGVTDVDLFIPILTYVYGEAQLGGKTCIISIHRLNEGVPPISSLNTYRSRIVKEAIHELGHTFKLRHCPDHSCIMHYCRTVGDVDRKSDQLCRYCSVLLEDEKNRLSETNS